MVRAGTVPPARGSALTKPTEGPRRPDHPLGAVALHGIAIERDVHEFENATRFRSVIAPAPERSDAREQLVQGEWLDQIVVRTRVEPFDPVADGRAGRQHQDRDL